MSRSRLTHFAVAVTTALALVGCSASSPVGSPPAAELHAAFAIEPGWPAAGQFIQFRDFTIGGPSGWSWSFGDGATSTIQNPTHAYAIAGTYTVILRVLGAGGTSTASSEVVIGDGTFRLTSSVAEDGSTLPREYSCDGAGDSPDLAWSGAPAATREFALVLTTLPVDGNTKWNWVLYGIPGACTGLARNGSAAGLLGTGSHGTTCSYDPPCPGGPGPKLYTFTLYALSASPVLPSDPSQVTGDVLTRAIQPLVLGAASLSMSYARP